MRQSERFQSPVPSPTSGQSGTHRKTPAPNVLREATELFASLPRHDIEEQRIFLELARNLLPSAPVQDRRRIAALLASHPETPDDLAETLAEDEDPLTAYPVLRYSPRLSVDLLARKAASGPETLRKAIANRPSLRESVIDALCETADASVIGVLLQRDDIRLKPAHQAKLSRRSEIVAGLGLELASRNALSQDGLMGQFLHLPVQLRAEAIAAAEMTSLVKQAQAPAGTADRHPSTVQFRLLDGLIGAALQKDRARFSDLLGQGLGLPLPTCDLLLQEDQGDGLIIALKGLGMTARETTTVLVRLFGERLALGDIRALLRVHRTLSRGAAEVLISQWILHDRAARPSDTTRHAGQYAEGTQERREQPAETGTATGTSRDPARKTG